MRNEKERAVEIWRRIEKMGKDERGCGNLPFGECKELPENKLLANRCPEALGNKGLPSALFLSQKTKCTTFAMLMITLLRFQLPQNMQAVSFIRGEEIEKMD